MIRRVVTVLAALILVTPAAAQTSTPTPAPTMDFGYVFTLEPQPAATGQPALGARIVYSMNLDGLVSGIFIFAIWLTILIALVIWLMQPKAPPKK